MLLSPVEEFFSFSGEFLVLLEGGFRCMKKNNTKQTSESFRQASYTPVSVVLTFALPSSEQIEAKKN